ncbi:Tetratricopeptide repeat superfamily protein [Perilla frutescens var. hirtella]|nr:Tetratricopeptide repeat superfamily protein [Perilla frutescens var. frutescens]KAH6784602.1 Tetratricopeptide repeat superfamily protein [Perilla frutescens var. hirtella]
MLKSCLRKGLLELSDKVLRVVDDMELERNRKTFEILIDYYVNAGRLNDTWLVLAEKKRKGYDPNSYVYSKIIEIYRDNGMWKKAMGVVEEIRAMGMYRRIYGSVIDTFSRNGELGEALEVFEDIFAYHIVF